MPYRKKNKSKRTNKKPYNRKPEKFEKNTNEPVRKNENEDFAKKDTPSLSVKTKWAGLVFVVFITILAFIPSFENEVSNWDDDKYILRNTQTDLSFEGIKKMFVEQPYYMGNFHPLAMFSLAIDHKLSEKRPADERHPFGWVDAFWFHFTNLLLHTISTVLIFFLAIRIFKFLNYRYYLFSAILMAALFGVHTLHVESVVWLSERKDVLYVMFFIAGLLSYTRYLESNKIGYFILTFFLYLLSLLSKGQAVSFAITLLAMDYIYKKNLLSVKTIAEKIPFIALALIFGIIAIKAQQHGQAIHSIAEYTHFERIMIASYGMTQYLWKLIIPLHLSAIYPYPFMTHQFPWYYFLSFITPLTLLALFIFRIKGRNEIVFSILFFGINIALLLQIIPVGSAIIADRYAYVPSIAYCFVLAFAYNFFLTKKPKLKLVVSLIFVGYILLHTVLTMQRCTVWKNSIALWDDVIEKYDKAVVAYNNRGSSKKALEDFDGAIADFSKAIELKPDYKHAIYNRGTARKDKKDYKGAMADFNLALLMDPKFAEAYHNRGITKDNMNDLQGAIADYNKAIEFNITDVKPFVNRGVAFGKMGYYEKAIEDFNQALRMDPENADAYSNRGLAKSFMKNYEDALLDFSKAISLRPDFADAYYNRALSKDKLKDFDGAIADHTIAMRYKKDFYMSFYYRGLAYLGKGEKQNACADFRHCLQLGYAPAQTAIDTYCK